MGDCFKCIDSFIAKHDILDLTVYSKMFSVVGQTESGGKENEIGMKLCEWCKEKVAKPGWRFCSYQCRSG